MTDIWPKHSRGFWCIIDDIVIYDSDPQQHTTHLVQFLQHCVDKYIAPNFDKCKFYQTEVIFAGFRLSAQGYQVDHSLQMPDTSSKTFQQDLSVFFWFSQSALIQH